MKKIFKLFLLIFMMGFSAYLGTEYMNLKYTLNDQPLKDGTIPLATLLQSSDVKIPSKNFHCEGTKDQKVGTILSTILTSALNDKESRLTYDCSDNTKTSTTDCKFISFCGVFKNPDECSSRSLSFTTDKNKTIMLDSFSCLDAP